MRRVRIHNSPPQDKGGMRVITKAVVKNRKTVKVAVMKNKYSAVRTNAGLGLPKDRRGKPLGLPGLGPQDHN